MNTAGGSENMEGLLVVREVNRSGGGMEVTMDLISVSDQWTARNNMP